MPVHIFSSDVFKLSHFCYHISLFGVVVQLSFVLILRLSVRVGRDAEWFVAQSGLEFREGGGLSTLIVNT